MHLTEIAKGEQGESRRWNVEDREAEKIKKNW